jgi:tetratricopeptide (TPR) repeat protein
MCGAGLMLLKARSLQNRLRFVLTVCAAALVGGVGSGHALAASSANSSATAVSGDDAFDSTKMSAAEKLYFGSSFEQLPAEQRIDKLERGVFGRNRSGSLNKRFERIASALGAQKLAASDASGSAPASADHAVCKDATPLASVTDTSLQPEPKPEAKVESKTEQKVESKTEEKSEEKLIATAAASDSKKSQAAEQAAIDAPVQALLKSGMAAHRGGQTQMAEAHFKAALSLDPRCADAFYNLGSIAESKGDLLSALTNYRAALGINPLDRELQNAVKSVEDDVAKSRATASSAAKNQPVKTVASNAKSKNAMPKTAPPFNHANGYQGASYAGYTPSTAYVPSSADSKLFNLQTAQNDALMQAQGNYPPLANVSQPAIPVYNVSQQSAPLLSVNQPNQTKPPNHSSSGVNSVLNVLMMSTPLHCPICRLKQMGAW